MAVNRHKQPAVKCAEEHSMSEIGRRNRLLLLNPRSLKSSRLGIGHALSVDIIYPACPYYAEPSGSGTEQVGPVGHSIGTLLAVDFLATPRRITCTEQYSSLSHTSAKIGLQLNALYRTIPILQPLPAVDHVRLAVGVDPESAVESQFVGRQICVIGHRTIRAFGFVAYQYVTRTTLKLVAAILSEYVLAVGKCCEVVIFSFILVKLGCPNHGVGPHPRLIVGFGYTVWAVPQPQVAAFP